MTTLRETLANTITILESAPGYGWPSPIDYAINDALVDLRAQLEALDKAEPVGIMAAMPGTVEGFSVAAFESRIVPPRTKLYTTPQPRHRCVWSRWDDAGSYVYRTTCKRVGTVQSGMKFCPFCGGEIEGSKWVSQSQQKNSELP